MSFLISQDLGNLLFRIFAAAFLGAVLGLERDVHGRGAGLRTHLLVSSGAALFTILSTRVAVFGVVVTQGFTTVTDPGRIAAQIVTGIGFLGAGVIIKEGFTVRGLTTAACLWIAAAIGMAAGAGFYIIAAVTTAMALFALILLRRFEGLYPRDAYRDLYVSVANDVELSTVLEVVKKTAGEIIFFGLDRNYDTPMTTMKISLRLSSKGPHDRLGSLIVKELELSGIALRSVKWERP
jgi:putative Mg2+ transporter-C (MgtC) family protein